MLYENIPTVIFSHPTIGCVGMSEEKATDKYGKESVKVYKSKFTNMFYALSIEEKLRIGTLFKIICHIEPPKNGENPVERVVGVHGIGKGIDEIL